MTRALGWKPEPAHRRVSGRIATAARARIGALLQPEETVPKFDPWVLDQTIHWEGCSGHNAAGAIYEKTGKKVSPWMPWVFALLSDGNDPEHLPNEGVSSFGILRSFRKHGSCRYEDWSDGAEGFHPLSIPPAVLRADAQAYNCDAIPLFASGPQLVALLVDGLARGYSGGIVVDVDRSFDNAGSDPVGPAQDKGRGQHIITLRRALRWKGATAIEIVNSWGTSWGDGGLARLTAERVGQAPFAWLLRGVS